ncbi:hypothetical protein BH23CHL1_BH23CHL1_26140 [soil metagenome]
MSYSDSGQLWKYNERDHVSNQDAPTRTSTNLEQTLMVARYGSPRSAVGSTLFSWLNLSLLLAFGWPALVVFFDAPTVSIENTPADWFALRLGVAVVGGGLTLLLWKLSPVTVYVATSRAVVGIFRKGMFWTQAVLFLAGVSLLLSALLLEADPGPAGKVVVFGLVEAIAIQVLLSGYMKGALDVLFPSRQSFLYVLGLFAAFFSLRSFAFAVTASGGGENTILALLAGGLLGIVFGSVSLMLRDRSGSLLPGILVHWVVLHLVVPYLG